MDRKRESLARVRAIANYQFENEVGSILFPDDTKITYSKKTGRLRHFYLEGAVIATLRPTDGFLSLTLVGAKRLVLALTSSRFRVVVREDVVNFVAEGGDVFARHVIEADSHLRAGEEVLVNSPKGDLVAVGKALLTGKEMLGFKRGVAVKVRKGVDETR
jgi:predicted RNA-binding protein (TIGR00451 family)